jgi:hypothetical protein
MTASRPFGSTKRADFGNIGELRYQPKHKMKETDQERKVAARLHHVISSNISLRLSIAEAFTSIWCFLGRSGGNDVLDSAASAPCEVSASLFLGLLLVLTLGLRTQRLRNLGRPLPSRSNCSN